MAADSLRGLAHEVAQENLPSNWKVDLRLANPLLKLCQRTRRTFVYECGSYKCGRFSITIDDPFFCGVAMYVSMRMKGTPSTSERTSALSSLSNSSPSASLPPSWP